MLSDTNHKMEAVMQNADPKIIEMIKDARLDLEKYGEEKCFEVLSLTESKVSMTDIVKRMNCTFLEAADMFQAAMRKKMDDLDIDSLIADKKHLPNCPIPQCEGKLDTPKAGTQHFICDRCNEKFKLKLPTK